MFITSLQKDQLVPFQKILKIILKKVRYRKDFSYSIILSQERLNMKVFSDYQNLRNALKCNRQPLISNSGYHTNSITQNHLKHLTEWVD